MPLFPRMDRGWFGGLPGILFIIWSLSPSLAAQNPDDEAPRFHLMATTGLILPLPTEKVGFQLALNPTYRVGESPISVEVEAAYLNYRFPENDNLYSARANGFQLLFGPRFTFPTFYGRNEERPKQAFVHLLAGNLWGREVIDLGDDDIGGFVISGGAYLKLKRWVVGVSGDSQPKVLMRVGYDF